MTILHEFGRDVGTAFGHFLLGSHNIMLMALGSCVKWLLEIFGSLVIMNIRPSIFFSNM